MIILAKLTDKQEKFVQELIKGKSQREAYRIAYPKSKASDNTVDVKASKLFSLDKVRIRYDEINDRLVKEAEDECIVDAKRVLKELSKIAFSNGTDFAKVVTKKTSAGNEYQHVEILDTDSLPENKKSAISNIKETKYGISVESYDKVKALELIGKHLGMFKETLELSGGLNVNNPFEDLSTEELRKLARSEKYE